MSTGGGEMNHESGAETQRAIRVRVARPESLPSGGASPVGGAFIGFVLGSLAGISFLPPGRSDEGLMLGNVVGGLLGAIVAASWIPVSNRLFRERLGIRGRIWAAGGTAALASFVTGSVISMFAPAMADSFLGAVRGGNELLPAVVAAAALALLTSLLLVVLEENADGLPSGPNRPRSGRTRLWSVISAGGLVGGVVGMLGGSVASAITEASKGDLAGLVQAARGGLILAGWTGSLVGLLAAAAFFAVAHLLHRARSPRPDST